MQRTTVNVLIIGTSRAGKSTIRSAIAGLPYEESRGGIFANWVDMGDYVLKVTEISGLHSADRLNEFDLVLYVIPLNTLLRDIARMERKIGELQDKKDGLDLFVVYTKKRNVRAPKSGSVMKDFVIDFDMMKPVYALEEDHCVTVFDGDLLQTLVQKVKDFALKIYGRKVEAERQRQMWLDSALTEMSGAAHRCKYGDETLKKISDVLYKSIEDVNGLRAKSMDLPPLTMKKKTWEDVDDDTEDEDAPAIKVDMDMVRANMDKILVDTEDADDLMKAIKASEDLVKAMKDSEANEDRSLHLDSDDESESTYEDDSDESWEEDWDSEDDWDGEDVPDHERLMDALQNHEKPAKPVKPVVAKPAKPVVARAKAGKKIAMKPLTEEAKKTIPVVVAKPVAKPVKKPVNARKELWSMVRNSEEFKRLNGQREQRWGDFSINGDVTALWTKWYDNCWLPEYRAEMLDDKMRVKMHSQTFKSELKRILYHNWQPYCERADYVL